jgi:hypothetical protein
MKSTTWCGTDNDTFLYFHPQIRFPGQYSWDYGSMLHCTFSPMVKVSYSSVSNSTFHNDENILYVCYALCCYKYGSYQSHVAIEHLKYD